MENLKNSDAKMGSTNTLTAMLMLNAYPEQHPDVSVGGDLMEHTNKGESPGMGSLVWSWQQPVLAALVPVQNRQCAGENF